MRAEVENASEAQAKNALEHLLVKLEGTVMFLDGVGIMTELLTSSEELIRGAAKDDINFVTKRLLK